MGIVSRPLPLLFFDVDGPLNPYAAKPVRRATGVPGRGARGHVSRLAYRWPLRVWLNPEHGQRALLQLDYELCWATTWMHDANKWIGPVLGLPGLPFVDFGDDLLHERPDGVHWKTSHLVEYANGRPFAWVDDEQSEGGPRLRGSPSLWSWASASRQSADRPARGRLARPFRLRRISRHLTGPARSVRH